MLYCGEHSLLGIEAVIFDKDGTLADSRQFLGQLAYRRAQRCVESIVQPINLSPGDLIEYFLAVFGVFDTGIDPDGLMAAGTRQSNLDAAVEVWLKAGALARETIETLVAEQFALADRDVMPKALHTPPFPGTGAMLQRLHQSGFKIGVLSSDSGANVEAFLGHYDLMPWVDDWQGTEPGDRPKPAPDLLYRLCARMGVAAMRTVVVGDSWVDQSLAQSAAAFLSVSESWGRPPVAGSRLILHRWDDLRGNPEAQDMS